MGGGDYLFVIVVVIVIVIVIAIKGMGAILRGMINKRV